MSVEIRIIGTPEDVAEAENALRDRFAIHSMKHYPSRRGDDRLSYVRASVKDPEPAQALIVPHDLANLKVKLQDLGDTNNVFLCYRFELDHYLDFGTASDLNRRIQSELRDLFGRMEGVDGRLDQTLKNPRGSGIAVFNSGPDWIVVPYDGGME